ncbi:hypothetical protein Micbo1qcDRAFT_214731 [Microdochium bolleyi]|uniref:Uncharacterized protein n=1 Tax=Microdochium bolleyi TaxID=196109 RepID=A0A136ITF0_9PEZI|nr:hypothetical protein Micbo1qcDRAFT_214731 [Microdochium bolleyi]
MVEVEVRKERAVPTRETAARLQQDLKLSLGQTQSVPDMLMTAPLAINLLGQIKLLAFTDHALRIRLTEPSGGFKHLKRKTLSSAIIQIVDQATESFDSAEKALRRIRMQTNVMFGKTGHVQTILICLQDPRAAKRDLRNSMTQFEQDMERCATWASEAEAEFDALVKSACEVRLALADEITNTSEQEEKLRHNRVRVETQKDIQNTALDVLKARTTDAESDFRVAKMQYQETAAKGEGSALAIAAAVGIGSSFTSLINGAISVFKDAPKLTSVAIKAIRSIGTIGIDRQTSVCDSNGKKASGSPTREGSVVHGLDPGLLAAEQIESRLMGLSRLMDDDLRTTASEDLSEIKSYANRFSALKTTLGKPQSKHTTSASAILDEALDLTAAIAAQGQRNLTAGQWEAKTARWRQDMASLLTRATQLQTYAASQPGQGSGGPLDPSSLKTIDPSCPAFERVLHQRHQKLLITRSAMNGARSNMYKAADMQLQLQARITEISCQMSEVQHKQDVAAETKKILSKSMGILVEMKLQVQQLTGFFNSLANIINIVCMGHAEQYLRAIDAGVTRQGGHFAIAYSEQQLQVIRETLITLRGDFGFVVHSADMYQEVATTHINPWIRMAANLPLSAGPAEQEEAKRELEKETLASANAIKLLAERETERYHKTQDDRVEEIEKELSRLGLPPLSEDDENLKAIAIGVKESSDEIARDIEEAGRLFEHDL